MWYFLGVPSAIWLHTGVAKYTFNSDVYGHWSGNISNNYSTIVKHGSPFG